MLGAMIGDMAGSVYEFDNIKTTEFDLLGPGTFFTDDTVMTCAVAQGLMEGAGDEKASRQAVIRAMQELGHQFPHAGYGGRFRGWLASEHPHPYNSWGNGSAMRVSPAGWLYGSLEETERFAKISAEVTHNHPEGIKGAQSVAAAIYLLRTGSTKDEVRAYVEDTYGYDLSMTCGEIRPTYRFNESCQHTVPQAFVALLEGEDFEQVIRLSVSLGGDSDTLAAIAGSMAEATYEIPGWLKQKALDKLEEPLLGIYKEFNARVFE